MSAASRLLSGIVLLASFQANAGESDDWSATLEKLLESRAPLPDWRPYAPYAEAPPPEDAPLEVLAAWWSSETDVKDLQPGPRVRERLLAAVREDPEALPELLYRLPETPAARRAVREIHASSADRMSKRRREVVSEWLAEIEEVSDDKDSGDDVEDDRPVDVEADPPAAHLTDDEIAALVRLVGNDDLAVHEKAVRALVEIEGRADALRPLLPWLKDLSWPGGDSWAAKQGRGSVVANLCRVKLPESVPGLIHVLRTEKFDARDGAARALAFQGDGRAVSALEEVLKEERNELYRRRILEALAACGGLDRERKAAAIEAYARQVSTEEGSEMLKAARWSHGRGPEIDPLVSAGLFLSDGSLLDEDLVARLDARARALEEMEPRVALTFRRVFATWTHRAAAMSFAGWLARGSPDATTLENALDRRRTIVLHTGEFLRGLAGSGGFRGGIAAAFLDDETLSTGILHGSDRDAKVALLACARHARMPLPVATVGQLLRADDALLSRAAEAYLIAEDSREAQELVLARHPGEMLILGRRTAWDPGHYSFESLGEWGDLLAVEMRRADGPEEIIALLSAGYWGDVGQAMLLVRKGTAELLLRPDGERYRKRPLSDEEWSGLRRFIEESRFFELPPLETSVHDGMQYEAIRLTRRGGRRVFMNNPGNGGSAGSPYDLLVRRFHRLAAVPGGSVRYDLLEAVPGGSLVFSGVENASRVWGTDAGILVRIETEDGDDRGPWRLIIDGKLGDPAERPREWPHVELGKIDERFLRQTQLNSSPWQAAFGGKVVIATIQGEEDSYAPALRSFGADGKNEVIRKGTYANPILTPDGKWLLAAKSGPGGWANPNPVVRIRMEDRDESLIDLPPADDLSPLARVEAHHAVLIHRIPDEDSRPEAEEYYLHDPETGKVERVHGEFRPWFDAQDHSLQAADGQHRVWAAIPGADESVVGRYDTRKFAFEPAATYPKLRFTSDRMWIDANRKRLYVLNKGDLLSLPFPP